MTGAAHVIGYATSWYDGDDEERGSVACRVAEGGRVLVVAEAGGARARSTGAAARAVDAFLEALTPEAVGDDATARIGSAFVAANAAVLSDDPGAGVSVLTDAVSLAALLFLDTRVAVASIGNCRCYRARGGGLSPLTQDHSVVAEVLRGGGREPAPAATPDPFETHHRNLLTRALGIASVVDFDIRIRTSLNGDQYLLCSSDFWSNVAVLDILRSMSRSRTAEDACALLRACLRAPGDAPPAYALIVAQWGGGEPDTSRDGAAGSS